MYKMIKKLSLQKHKQSINWKPQKAKIMDPTIVEKIFKLKKERISKFK